MGLFANWKRSQALKRYARELPRRLSHDYGASTFFTRGQIATAITKLKLNPNFSAYAYAMFLSDDDYNAGLSSDPALPAYDKARTEFARNLLSTPSSQASFTDALEATDGGGGAGHGAGF